MSSCRGEEDLALLVVVLADASIAVRRSASDRQKTLFESDDRSASIHRCTFVGVLPPCIINQFL